MPQRVARMFIAALLLLALSRHAAADLLADWGVIPIGSETSFVFQPSDASTNFTDQYSFTLAGDTSINYSAAYFLASCMRGCGSPVLEFGIYSASGGLLDAGGSTLLGAGNYVFQIKGTGMGSGNMAGSGGNISFYTTAPVEMVSPAPEPAAWLLMLSGLAFILAGTHWRGRKS